MRSVGEEAKHRDLRDCAEFAEALGERSEEVSKLQRTGERNMGRRAAGCRSWVTGVPGRIFYYLMRVKGGGPGMSDDARAVAISRLRRSP